MPTVRALFSQGLPGIFGFSSQGGRSGYDYNNSDGSRGISSKLKTGNNSSTGTKPRNQQEWSGNQSDVELVPVEKMRTDSPEEGTAPRTLAPGAKTADQWRTNSAFELPMQGSEAQSDMKSDQWSGSTGLGLPRQGTRGSM
jgi:hypothetical protein